MSITQKVSIELSKSQYNGVQLVEVEVNRIVLLPYLSCNLSCKLLNDVAKREKKKRPSLSLCKQLGQTASQNEHGNSNMAVIDGTES